MDKSFNQFRYLELLKKEELFRTQNKWFFQENKEEFRELTNYVTILESQINYNQKDKYRSLLEAYLAKKIDAAIFRFEFLRLYKEAGKTLTIISKDPKQFSTFSIDLESNEFYSLIDKIFDECDALSLNLAPENEENYEISENQFQYSVQKIFSQMEKYFDNESENL